MVAVGFSFVFLLQMLHSSPGCWEGLSFFLYPLASIAELACKAVLKKPLQQRAATAVVLLKLVGLLRWTSSGYSISKIPSSWRNVKLLERWA
ncbi:hypothetical protein Nepgr_004814 [Nepenthes gracilis]|uniref:Uncharacterized protein n=1 Tax=Nepenthes gracilis TaxID=150966 RepID=A0AAD3S225_NEPGR|nr:hypothetical protein Nepgr_004814 [Nepenthes gracilis]